MSLTPSLIGSGPYSPHIIEPFWLQKNDNSFAPFRRGQRVLGDWKIYVVVQNYRQYGLQADQHYILNQTLAPRAPFVSSYSTVEMTLHYVQLEGAGKTLGNGARENDPLHQFICGNKSVASVQKTQQTITMDSADILQIKKQHKTAAATYKAAV